MRQVARSSDGGVWPSLAHGFSLELDAVGVVDVPAGDVEGAVLDHVQKLLAAPELVARTWSTAKRTDDDDVPEREVTTLLADFATVWGELFPAEQARIVQLLVERVEVMEDALEVRIRAEGLANLVAELRQTSPKMATAA
jgi:site-specific DNA recombinase